MSTHRKLGKPTDQRMAIYSFASGLILSLAVPVLVPAIIALPL